MVEDVAAASSSLLLRVQLLVLLDLERAQPQWPRGTRDVGNRGPSGVIPSPGTVFPSSLGTVTSGGALGTVSVGPGGTNPTPLLAVPWVPLSHLLIKFHQGLGLLGLVEGKIPEKQVACRDRVTA